ncbi:restriction endonuclease subunit S [Catenovulum sp. SM1970]|uniref:restriction endonuclease subunit S n=1 Tax=Marinifaba aquimaris TaxID=2741323 RepID=UPI001574988D|nr:restriction endonuclease subunit S [Marinifaba aquimaris]NTS78707.1 restriction endonuclease subunit S [Marinifaba aquimaris]
MGRYKEYQEYKNSEVEWLGKVPIDWDIKKIKYLSPVKRGASPRPIDDPKYFDEEGDYAWVRIADVSASDTYLYQTTQKMSELGSSLSVKLEPNQLFLSIAGTVGKPCINKIKACIHDGFVYFPDLKIPNKFLFYVFAGEQAYKGLGKMGTQLNLNTDTVGGIKVAIPKTEKDIQTIINFLDHETAKIDTLIEKQQQLIKLLKEKRQAVISHAVTKGLNPEAPMKDSGVEWLGEVPEHWDVKKLKYLVSEPLLYGANEAAEEVDKSQPRFVRITDVKSDGTLKEDTFRSLPKDVALPYMLKDGDILLARSGGTVGKSFIYRDSWGSCCFAGYLIKASINEDIVAADWVYFNTLTSFYWDWIQGSQIQATIQNVSAEKYNLFQVAIPPKEECKIIINFIFENLNKFDELTKKAERAILLMRERRTALISAAVTGKIDVRNWQKPEESKEEVV